MEKIKGANRKLIQNAVDFARKFMKIPEDIELYFEDCPSERFPNENNAAEGEIDKIVFNKVWFYRSRNDHKDDIEYFVFHELRHTYQLNEIGLMMNGMQIHEKISLIETWKEGFENYIPNVDKVTQSLNFHQEVEQDAYGYGLALLDMYYIKRHDFRFRYSMTEEVFQIADSRSRKYRKELPEFQRYIADNCK